jgi:hypothetical protein
MAGLGVRLFRRMACIRLCIGPIPVSRELQNQITQGYFPILTPKVALDMLCARGNRWRYTELKSTLTARGDTYGRDETQTARLPVRQLLTPSAAIQFSHALASVQACYVGRTLKKSCMYGIVRQICTRVCCQYSNIPVLGNT